jgi:hypothetical protein
MSATADVPSMLAQWDDWTADATDRLMHLDERVTALGADLPGAADVQLDVAAAFVCRKAIAARVEQIRAAPSTAAAASATPVLDDRGDLVAADLPSAATLLNAVLDRVDTAVSAAETANRARFADRASAGDDLRVAERLSVELGHFVQRTAAARARFDAAGSSAVELRAVAAEARILRDELERLRTTRTSAFDQWRTLPDRLTALRAREREVRELVDTCREKVTPLPVLAMPSVDALGPVRPLDELEAMPWPAARMAMEPYLLRVERLGAAFDEVARRFGSVLDRRNELRGLLHAFRDKAAAAGLGEDAELEPVFRTAEHELWSAPCDVEAAEGLVREYTDAVNVAVASRALRRRDGRGGA